MEIKKENIVKAYSIADDDIKDVLLELFPELLLKTAQTTSKRPITERIKTFEDACKELGNQNIWVQGYEDATRSDFLTPDLLAYLKLRIICAALNEGWKPRFTEGETRWYPWHWFYTQEEMDGMSEAEKSDRCMMTTGGYRTEYAGFASGDSYYAPSYSATNVGSRLCLKSEELAEYCGKQFIELWADFKLIRK